MLNYLITIYLASVLLAAIIIISEDLFYRWKYPYIKFYSRPTVIEVTLIMTLVMCTPILNVVGAIYMLRDGFRQNHIRKYHEQSIREMWLKYYYLSNEENDENIANGC